MSKKTLKFRKMHGLGNDFVIFDARATEVQLSPEDIQMICNRNYGVGCDQLVIIKGDNTAFFFNTDGSESAACGNATRCVADLLMKEQETDRLVVKTKSGSLECWRIEGEIEVNMGVPKFEWNEIPLAHPVQNLQFSELPIPTVVNVGNPHCVFFLKNIENVPVEKFGSRLETNPIFPERANIGFAEVYSPNHIRLRVWERGAGETLACGSGACAAVVAGHVRSLLNGKTRVDLDGGTLTVDYNETVYMRGPVKFVFEGTITL
jgi:diaminopimelate epimerase